MRESSQNFMRLLLVAILCLAASPIIKAQSTVYVFVRSTFNSEIQFSKNGKNIFEMRGLLKKTQKDVPGFKMPVYTYSEAYRKCTFNDEGKVIFGFEYKYTNPVNLEVSVMADEIQLNLSPGSVHYIFITNKGKNDSKFEELSEKEANKKLKDKKYVALEEYSE